MATTIATLSEQRRSVQQSSGGTRRSLRELFAHTRDKSGFVCWVLVSSFFRFNRVHQAIQISSGFAGALRLRPIHGHARHRRPPGGVLFIVPAAAVRWLLKGHPWRSQPIEVTQQRAGRRPTATSIAPSARYVDRQFLA
eukprot:9489611-Pyramimonas_sp.AAC.1